MAARACTVLLGTPKRTAAHRSVISPATTCWAARSRREGSYNRVRRRGDRLITASSSSARAAATAARVRGGGASITTPREMRHTDSIHKGNRDTNEQFRFNEIMAKNCPDLSA